MKNIDRVLESFLSRQVTISTLFFIRSWIVAFPIGIGQLGVLATPHADSNLQHCSVSANLDGVID